ncbi:MAG: hypothetical protein ACRD0K_26200 [Egibacteraceae bacterium]
MTHRKLRSVLMSAMVTGLMALGSAPAAYATHPKEEPPKKQEVLSDNDVAVAKGGNGGNGGIGVGVGVCAVNVSVVAPAGCPDNGVGDAKGGFGGGGKAIADFN